MGYLVSFLGGALGFSIFDKSINADNKGLSIFNVISTAFILYFGYKMIKKL